jgi:hypothetical protein
MNCVIERRSTSETEGRVLGREGKNRIYQVWDYRKEPDHIK